MVHPRELCMEALLPHPSDQVQHQILPILKKDGVVVMPTDTIYGVVASIFSPKAVEKIFSIRRRDRKKPVIILIGDMGDLTPFSVTLDPATQKFLHSVWPGKVSVVFPVKGEKWVHLHRGTHSLAFRLPDDSALRALIKMTGPLIAPSANPAGFPPATTVAAAKKYFGDQIDLYIDGGVRESAPSTLVAWTPEGVTLLREGAVDLSTRQKIL